MGEKFSDHYDDWIQTRMNGVKKYIGESYFKNKTLLELGCGYGHVGNEFSKLGANVTCADARKEHLMKIFDLYPHLKTMCVDCDKSQVYGTYDIVVHFGLLYHLKEIENHLASVSKSCNVLILETEVSDSDDDDFRIITNEEGYDQAFGGKGIRPSPPYVEKVLNANGFQCKRIEDPILNSTIHIYDWPIQNTKRWPCGLRKFWICWKNVDCPILDVESTIDT